MIQEAEAAQQLGESIGAILVAVGAVPSVLAAPIVALFGCVSFLFGKKYERKWAKKAQKIEQAPAAIVETINGEENVTDSSST